MLILRLGAMGDILHALPAITALRQAQPDWFLSWAVEPQWQALLSACGGSASRRSAGQPLVDRLHLVPAKAWARAPLHPRTAREVLHIRRALRDAHYDVALDLQGAVRSALLARAAHPRRTVGEAQPREAPARFLFSERIATTGVHVIEQAVEVTQALTPTPLAPVLPLLPVDPDAEAWAAVHTPASPFVLLSPGAGWGAKRWPLACYASLARSLQAAGLAVIFNAGPAEQSEVAPVAAQTGSAILAPSLGQLIAITRRAALAIAGDTGPLHLAAALGLPTVGIFGPTDPARNGPFHGRFAILRHPGSRRDHTRRSQTEAGLLAISPEQVLRAALGLLDGHAEPHVPREVAPRSARTSASRLATPERSEAAEALPAPSRLA